MITIGLINRNYAEYLPTALSSIQKQSVLPKQLIIVDDASTDDSQEIIQKYVKDISSSISTKVINLNSQSGSAVARNHIIQNTIEDFILFLDSDNFLNKNAIETHTDYINKFPITSIIYSDNEDYFVNNHQQKRTFRHAFDPRLLIYGNVIHSNSLFRTSIFKDLGRFNPDYSGIEEYDFWIRAANKVAFGHIPYPLFVKRVHAKNQKSLRQVELTNKAVQLLNMTMRKD